MKWEWLKTMPKSTLPKAVIEYELKDPNGKTVRKGKFPAKSWAGNMLCLLESLLGTWGTTPAATNGYYLASRTAVLDTSNVASNVVLASIVGSVTIGGAAPVGDTTAGILVGSSDTPYSPDQYNLLIPIAHGTGSGQLQYGSTTVEPVAKGATAWTLRIIRTFSNSSGATVTVKEIGLFIRLSRTTSPYYFSAMLARDVPPSPINVPNGYTLTVRYVITQSIS